MTILSKLIFWLPLIATVVMAYLSVNKIWKRKHEPTVAQSISLLARCIGIVANIILIVQAFPKFFLVANFAVWLLVESILLFIGAGVWVADKRNKSLWQKVKSALKLEGKESGDLAKMIFQTSNADKLLSILSRMAYIDNHLSKEEKDMLMSFADDWNIEFKIDDVKPVESDNNETSYQLLRQELIDYLNLSPPDEQVSQLADVLQALIEVDGEVSHSEELMVEELTGIINKHLNYKEDQEKYFVAVIPEGQEQEDAIGLILSNPQKHKISGGYSYLDGPYFSKKYSEIICKKYHQFHCFAFVIDEKKVLDFSGS